MPESSFWFSFSQRWNCIQNETQERKSPASGFGPLANLFVFILFLPKSMNWRCHAQLWQKVRRSLFPTVEIKGQSFESTQFAFCAILWLHLQRFVARIHLLQLWHLIPQSARTTDSETTTANQSQLTSCTNCELLISSKLLIYGK